MALGAGPGASKTYYIDAPLPWGDNTPITVPVDAIVADFWQSLRPRLDAWADPAVNAAAAEIGGRVEEAVSKPLLQAIDAGSIIVQEVAWPALVAAAAIGAITGYAIAQARRR